LDGLFLWDRSRTFSSVGKCWLRLHLGPLTPHLAPLRIRPALSGKLLITAGPFSGRKPAHGEFRWLSWGLRGDRLWELRGDRVSGKLVAVR
jgi:hypothetical protein